MKSIFIFTLILLSSIVTRAQLEGLFIETYYVSDSLDATDTIGGRLQEGETTYRVFLDVAPGSKVLSLFGDAEHPFEIGSTRRFFNNVDGATFGYDIPKVSYESNTVGLDSYITIGKNGFQGLRNFYGLPKTQDDDGSFIGGLNNDGGSEFIEGGLLVNEDPAAGIPLTIADGMDTLNLNIADWFSFGIVDFASGLDSTIFSVNAVDSVFTSSQFVLQCEGVYGVIPDSNLVLVAQLTTLGEISLRLNAVVLSPAGDTLTYVGTNEVGMPNQFFAPYLVYPQVCGCMDPDYLEFCNYNPLANFNIQNTCCYPGFCQERDLEEVCPQLKGESFDFKIYPNPVMESTFVQVISGVTSDLIIEITDYNGGVVFSENVSQAPLNYSTQIDFSDKPSGIYLVRVTGVEGVKNGMLVKL